MQPLPSRLDTGLARRALWVAPLAGAVSATGFAPLSLWPLALVAIAAWIACVAGAATKRRAFLIGWLFGMGQFVVGLNWIAKAFTFQAAMPPWLGWIAVVLLSVYLAVYPALAALGASVIARRAKSARAAVPPAVLPAVLVVALAGAWVVTEWLRSWVFTGFIWNPLGALAIPLPTVESIRIVGTYGYGAVVIGIAGGLWLIARGTGAREWRAPLAATLALVGAAWGAGHLARPATLPTTRTPITVVQPNIRQEDKWRAGFEETNRAKLAALTVREGDAPRLLFWPEAAIPDYLETGYPRRYYFDGDAGQTRARLARLMKPGDTLVLGALKLEFEEGADARNARATGARNSVFALDDGGAPTARYDKAHLVPYGEYLPMRPFLSALGLSRLAPGDLDFWPGPGARSIDLPGAFRVKSGIQVCYEIIFSGQVVERGDRPRFLFNPSNDAWFGAWGPPQHLGQARMRALEEGLPVVRSTPTGISAVIDADGAVLAALPMGVAGRIDSALPAARGPTIFARSGNPAPLALAILCLVAALVMARRAA